MTSVIATVLVNGAAVTSVMLSPPTTVGNDTAAGEGEKNEEEETEYFLDIRSEGGRTSLATDGSERLWIYGAVQCSDPDVDTDALTRSLTMMTSTSH